MALDLYLTMYTECMDVAELQALQSRLINFAPPCFVQTIKQGTLDTENFFLNIRSMFA